MIVYDYATTYTRMSLPSQGVGQGPHPTFPEDKPTLRGPNLAHEGWSSWMLKSTSVVAVSEHRTPMIVWTWERWREEQELQRDTPREGSGRNR